MTQDQTKTTSHLPPPPMPPAAVAALVTVNLPPKPGGADIPTGPPFTDVSVPSLPLTPVPELLLTADAPPAPMIMFSIVPAEM